MDLFSVLWKTVLSIVILFLLTKMMGKKQISQLNLYDYVIGITIGSVVAEVSTNLETHFMNGALAMLVLALTSVFVSKLTTKNIEARRFIIGTPIVLIENGKILENSLIKAKFDITDLLREARVAGYFDITQIEYALMESDGKISFLPKSKYAPVTPDDMKLKVDKTSLVANLIIDGKIIEDNLRNIGKDKKWLMKRLENSGYKNVNGLLLVTCDNKEKLTIYEKNLDVQEFRVLD